MIWVLFVVLNSGLWSIVPLDTDMVYLQSQCETLGKAVIGDGTDNHGFVCARMAREDAIKFEAEDVTDDNQ